MKRIHTKAPNLSGAEQKQFHFSLETAFVILELRIHSCVNGPVSAKQAKITERRRTGALRRPWTLKRIRR